MISGALQISDSQETDQGNYECVAENSVGTQHAPAIMLYVRGRCIILFIYSFHYYNIIWSTKQTKFRTENPIVRKNKEQTRLKSHYFPFICCFFLFFHSAGSVHIFLTFILNVIYDSNLRARTGKRRNQTNL